MEMFLFRKHLRNESVFEMKVKLFYFLKHFFFQKCTKNNIFWVARMGHHTPATTKNFPLLILLVAAGVLIQKIHHPVHSHLC